MPVALQVYKCMKHIRRESNNLPLLPLILTNRHHPTLTIKLTNINNREIKPWKLAIRTWLSITKCDVVLSHFVVLTYQITFNKPPFTIIFCLSGGTPVRSYNWHLKTYGGWLVSISTPVSSSFCHFTLTAKIPTNCNVNHT